jgi:RHS repeat-associated protein
VVAVTDSAGGLLTQQRYLPFGEERDLAGYSMSGLTDYTYTGQRSLGEGMGGLMDYKARMYSPHLGRFISADTIVPNPMNLQSLNRFSYTYNNPIKYTDPSGHDPWWCETSECRTEYNNNMLALLPKPKSSSGGNPGGERNPNGHGGERDDGRVFGGSGSCDGTTGYCLPTTCDYYGECYLKIPAGPYSVYIERDPEKYDFVISDPQKFSEYLMVDHTDITEGIFTVGVGAAVPPVGIIEGGLINYFSEFLSKNTLQETGRYITRASIQNGNSEVVVSVIPNEYYKAGPYTNLGDRPLFHDGGKTVVLVQGVGSNQIQPIIVTDLYYPELMYVLTYGNPP